MNLAIFDVDGTLTQTNKSDTICFSEAVKQEFGIVSIDTDWSKYTYSTDSGILHQILQENLGRGLSHEDKARFQKRFIHLIEKLYHQKPDYFQATPGARLMVQRLRKEKGWRIAVASGGWRVSAELKLKYADIESMPGAFADDSFAREEIIGIAIERAEAFYQEVEFEKKVYIGDGVWDIRSSKRLKIPFVGIASNHHPSILQQEGALHILADFSDYDAFVKVLTNIQPL